MAGAYVIGLCNLSEDAGKHAGSSATVARFRQALHIRGDE